MANDVPAAKAVWLSLWLGMVSLGGASVLGQDEEEDLFRPGLIARYVDAGGRSALRIDPTVRFLWQGNPPDERLVAGKFRAHWRGFLMSQANGAYQLHAFVCGKVAIRLGGRQVLSAESASPAWFSTPALDLSFDYHPLEIEYERSAEPARLGLYWSGPQFPLEPLEGRQLFHDRRETPSATFQRGGQLVRALRCGACHEFPGASPILAAPALDRLAGNLRPEWLERFLTSEAATAEASAGQDAEEPARRMPHFPLSTGESQAVTAYLMARSLPTVSAAVPGTAGDSVGSGAGRGKKKRKSGEAESPPKSPLEAGRDLVHSVGCLACHRVGELGTRGWYDGGDLSDVGNKRPEAFFVRWLAAPAAINEQHRMPVMDLTDEERQQVGLYLTTLRGTLPVARPAGEGRAVAARDLIETGRRVFAERRCGACHQGPAGEVSQPGEPARMPLSAASRWNRSCAAGGRDSDGGARQPLYPLSRADQQAVHDYVTSLPPQGSPDRGLATLLAERNCLGCHARGGNPGLAARLGKLAEREPAWAPLLPALTPPALDSVGDKLHDGALRDAIRRAGPVHRPYLRVRMPRFAVSDEELEQWVNELTAADRIPPGAPGTGLRAPTTGADGPPSAKDTVRATVRAWDAVGSRLVTPDGFGCTSCHQVGSVLPAKAPLNARGPDLSLLGKRIRREWYDRWVRNPARIVPRMEMPSVQVAVRGVLHDDLDAQLAAVWDALNRPGFEPPEPDPVRTVRQRGTRADDRAQVITDLVRSRHGHFIKPLLIGLANRHNVLLDLESGQLAAWSAGDVARQRTEGKSWYWELAGQDVWHAASRGPEMVLSLRGEERAPSPAGQFVTEFDVLEHVAPGIRVQHRFQYDFSGPAPRQLRVSQEFWPTSLGGADHAGGFRRRIEVWGVKPEEELVFRLAGGERVRAAAVAQDGAIVVLRAAGEGGAEVRIVGPPGQRFQADGSLRARGGGADAPIRWELEYRAELPVDRYPVAMPSPAPLTAVPLHVVPGFEALRLPLSDEIMPTALAWRPDGTLVVASLKGQVWLARDADGDGLADRLVPFSDDLAAPYGLATGAGYVDVLNKYALLRLYDDDGDDRADRTITLASGWGHTADYHDWAVGLPRDEQGNYFVAIPCQQDQRSPAAARWRGALLKLVPRSPTEDDPRSFTVEPVSRGHRFPMGIARSRQGALFVTDNQGNYNPFNELNHVRPGAHFGFLNALDRAGDPRPPLTPPAINIPHPWTRSVNGICFLETPPAARERLGGPAFGPLEGHLIGCEMDTRRLVRMSLESVGDTYQGAAYPFSFDQPSDGPPLLGPLVCEVSPQGDLYVGGLRDSGWGGANNIGEIVRLRLTPQELPTGIAEMRVAATGFTLDFTSAVSREAARDPSSYSLSSYRRESTPAYGGPDLDRRTETITRVELSDDALRVTLHVRELRPGYVYELHVKNLSPGGSPFFPAEAHYTLNRVPR